MFKVGEEAIVDLTTFDTTGNRRANLRHTITRCRKDGVTFRWFAHGIPAYPYSTEMPVMVLGAKYKWVRGAGLI